MHRVVTFLMPGLGPLLGWTTRSKFAYILLIHSMTLVWGLKVENLGLEVGVWGFGLGVQGSGFRVQGSGFRIQISGFEFRVSHLILFRVSDYELDVAEIQGSWLRVLVPVVQFPCSGYMD